MTWIDATLFKWAYTHQNFVSTGMYMYLGSNYNETLMFALIFCAGSHECIIAKWLNCSWIISHEGMSKRLGWVIVYVCIQQSPRVCMPVKVKWMSINPGKSTKGRYLTRIGRVSFRNLHKGGKLDIKKIYLGGQQYFKGRGDQQQQYLCLLVLTLYFQGRANENWRGSKCPAPSKSNSDWTSPWCSCPTVDSGC